MNNLPANITPFPVPGSRFPVPRHGQQALEARLRQCPHSDLENPVRPPCRAEHIRLSP